jgi:phospholipase/carboxylesterase
MVIAIHGLGDRPDRFGKLFLQYQGKARIVLPRGPHRAGGGRSWFETDIRNGIVVKVDEEEFEESLRRLASLAKRVSEEKPTVGKPVVTGFSQGGILSFALAAESPESIRGAIPVAGMLPRKLWPVKAAGKDGMTCRLQALHGRDDSLVPYDEAKSSVEHLAKMGWEAQLETFPDTGHTISFEMRQRLYELLETWQ